MGVASADNVGPINRLQEALRRRANWEMHWHKGPDPDDPRSRLVDIVGGRLLLSHFPHYAKLTVIYETTAAAQDGRRERGRRVAGAGSVARMYAVSCACRPPIAPTANARSSMTSGRTSNCSQSPARQNSSKQRPYSGKSAGPSRYGSLWTAGRRTCARSTRWPV